MKFFVDTANVSEIKQAEELGVLDGVTTNPSLVSKEGGSFEDLLKQITSVTSGPVSAEVVSLESDQMIEEGKRLAKIASNIVVKIPLIPEGLKATQVLSCQGVKVNVTLCFSATQALLAAKAGASYISPFVGRLDDISIDGMQLIRDIKTIYTNYNYKTEILVASIRHPIHVLEAAKIGADVCTMPFSVIMALYKHPLTDIGLKRFLDDWNKSKKKTENQTV